ncbi:unnamed protein product [Gordionus sp. m RMFG-2023]
MDQVAVIYSKYFKLYWMLILYLTVLASFVAPLVNIGQAFILDRELGMFACQLNPSINSLSLYNISALCDGVPHCFNRLDEDRDKLECKNDCHPKCVHGTCLKGPQCYCDCDWGGKDCNIPDINECKNSPCHNMAFCTNTLGSFYCTCLPGFTGNGFECKDIDECNNPITEKDVQHHSSNIKRHHRNFLTQGSVSSHNSIMNRHVFLKDNVNKVDNSNLSQLFSDPVPTKACAQNGKCYNVPGSYYCECNPGFEGNGYISCTDLNECDNPITCMSINYSRCLNTIGSYRCECLRGFTNQNGVCRDVDECSASLGKCQPKARCVNIPGSFQCRCKKGFVGFGKLCQDIDECKEPSLNSCDINSECLNTEGSFICYCHAGFRSVGEFCQDINECEEVVNATTGINYCQHNAKCVNNPLGGYTCMCPSGYFGNGVSSCDDIDECLLSSHNCTSPASCVNTEGSFNCVCPSGSISSEDGCRADDQCDPSNLGSNVCSLNSECTLIDGTFKCICNKGFDGNGTFCYDIDECIQTPSLCHPERCVNSIGGYFCSKQERNDNLINEVARPMNMTSHRFDGAETDSLIQRLENSDSIMAQDLTQYKGLHRTLDINPNDMIQITCKANGIDMRMDFSKFNPNKAFNGIMYVKGNFKINQCRKVITGNRDNFRVSNFYVKYGDCSFDINLAMNEYSTIIVLQPHLTLLTYDAKAYKVYCYYQETERMISNDLNVSTIEPNQILKATGGPPPCQMEILDSLGHPITTTDLGTKLQLKISLASSPKTNNYGLMAKNCIAKTITEDWEYALIDSRGCSTDDKLFENFQVNSDRSISAFFSAFKFPNSVYMRFKCEVKICFGSCEPAMCNGSNIPQRLYKRDIQPNTNKSNMVIEKVESRLMKIKVRSDEDYDYFEDIEEDDIYVYEENGYHKTDQELRGQMSNTIPNLKEYTGGNLKAINKLRKSHIYNNPTDHSLNPVRPLTCVSKVGLATGLSLTLVLTMLGASILAVSVKRQVRSYPQSTIMVSPTLISTMQSPLGSCGSSNTSYICTPSQIIRQNKLDSKLMKLKAKSFHQSLEAEDDCEKNINFYRRGHLPENGTSFNTDSFSSNITYTSTSIEPCTDYGSSRNEAIVERDHGIRSFYNNAFEN